MPILPSIPAHHMTLGQSRGRSGLRVCRRRTRRIRDPWTSTGTGSSLISWTGTGATSFGRALDGLTGDEYVWEPVSGCWSVRRADVSVAPLEAGSGAYTIDFAFRQPDPALVTTIAWRLAHIVVGIFGARAARRLAELRLRGHGGRGARPARRHVRRVDRRGKEVSGRKASRGRAPRRKEYQRSPDGRARPAHQPRGPPPGAEIALLRDLYLRDTGRI